MFGGQPAKLPWRLHPFPGFSMRLRNRLKVARAERGLSQERLAELAGVTRQTISSIETGQYVPSALLAFVLAARLGVRVDDLFTLVQGDEP